MRYKKLVFLLVVFFTPFYGETNRLLLGVAGWWGNIYAYWGSENTLVVSPFMEMRNLRIEGSVGFTELGNWYTEMGFGLVDYPFVSWLKESHHFLHNFYVIGVVLFGYHNTLEEMISLHIGSGYVFFVENLRLHTEIRWRLWNTLLSQEEQWLAGVGLACVF